MKGWNIHWGRSLRSTSPISILALFSWGEEGFLSLLSLDQRCHGIGAWWVLLICMAAAAAAKSHQSYPTLCDPIDGSPPGSPVPGIPQARILEWVAIFFSNACKWKVKVKSLSCVRLFATLWTVAYQAPPSVGFSRQEYRSGLPLPSPSVRLISS